MKFPEAFEVEASWLIMMRAHKLAEFFEPVTESPIETIMAVTTVIYAQEIGVALTFPTQADDLEKIDGSYFASQWIIGNYRVDFLLGDNRVGTKIIVECDGKDFHHARREQIERDRARDRELECLGFKVMRFPGTQIHNETWASAMDVAHSAYPLESKEFILSIRKYLQK